MMASGKNRSSGNDEAQTSHGSQESHPILPPRGDYQTLLSFQKAEVVYDITFRFAHKFLARGDRTVDQITSSTNNSVGWKRSFSRKAACANA